MTLLAGPEPGATEVTVWSLEMNSLAELRPGRVPHQEPLLLDALRPAPELSRFCYELVGGPWHWCERGAWTRAQWLAWVDRPEHHLVTAWLDGVPAGYFELEQQPGGDVALAYFGLAPGFSGQGLGGWLLTQALVHAWCLKDTRRVWVHTCSLDGPAALPNYQARGMVRFAEATEWHLL